MKNYANNPEMPMGLGMALAQNLQAMQYYASLGPERQQKIIDHTHSIHSKQEMQAFVNRMPGFEEKM